MDELEDAYQEPIAVSESLFKDKGSKHFGYVFPVKSVAEIELHLQELRKKHFAARHVCYAWTLGVDNQENKWTDDGEPHNSAGPPIMGQIQSFQLHNTLIAVVRYFGGTKLGVGGLINAYKTAAKEAILAGTIKEFYLQKKLRLTFPYTLMSDVMRNTKADGVKIVSQDFREACNLEILVRLKFYSKTFEILSNLHPIEIKEIPI
tara:strand:+ start:156051 stop:156665 length:615 start_codon:yes stop_codon:yes gene_type:complete